MRWAARIAREPLLHFLLIGVCIYALYGAFGPEQVESDARTITVTAGDIAWLTQSWEKRWNRPPTGRELDGLIEAHIKETVLYREALAMGLDRDDVIVRRRLAQKLTFLTQDLLQPGEPGESALREHFAANRDRYREPDRITFTQIFLDPDKRGERTLADVEAMKTSLASRDPTSSEIGALGDSFMLQAYYPDRSEQDIARFFGGGFAEGVMGLSPGVWHGPVYSGYGVHLVYVHAHDVAPPPDFESVRERVREDWLAGERKALDEKFLEELRGRYRIVIEEQQDAVQ